MSDNQTTEEKTIVEKTGGHFFAEKSSKGWAVYKDGGTTRYSDGTRSMGMNIPILVVSEWLSCDCHQDVCETTAKSLNAAAGASND